MTRSESRSRRPGHRSAREKQNLPRSRPALWQEHRGWERPAARRVPRGALRPQTRQGPPDPEERSRVLARGRSPVRSLTTPVQPASPGLGTRALSLGVLLPGTRVGRWHGSPLALSPRPTTSLRLGCGLQEKEPCSLLPHCPSGPRAEPRAEWHLVKTFRTERWPPAVHQGP